MRSPSRLALVVVPLLLVGASSLSCAERQSTASEPPPSDSDRMSAPHPRIQAWMDRLTVAHAYDPETGFIVAKETVDLPPLVADGPRIDDAVRRAKESDSIVIAFATADRCAPCQQYKKDALNDSEVIERLSDARFLPTHVEVDRESELAQAYLGGQGVPMTYAIRDGRVISTLRGQRSAADLLAWLDGLPAS